jgi:FkbM family methyltransferase
MMQPDFSKFEYLIFNTEVFKVNDKTARNVLLNCDHGTMIVNRFDCNHERVGHSQWLLDHGNTSTIEVLHSWDKIKTKKDAVIFDIGANIGTYTTWMSRAFPQGKVYSFEPQRAVFQMLCGNIAINNLYNVYTYNYAIGDSNTRIEVQEPNYFANEDYGTFSLVNDVLKTTTDEKLIVEVKTLDWFVDFYSVPQVDFIKIDVEGMDLAVLEGARETIRQHHPYLFIEHYDNRVSILDKLQAFLDEFEYEYDIVQNNLITR